MSLERRASYTAGLRAEFFARWLLRLKGYSIIEQRYKTPVGELDIVARRGKRIAFVEVKFRKDLSEAAFSITSQQRQRIVNAAKSWLQRNARVSYDTLSFDVILVAPWRLPRH